MARRFGLSQGQGLRLSARIVDDATSRLPCGNECDEQVLHLEIIKSFKGRSNAATRRRKAGCLYEQMGTGYWAPLRGAQAFTGRINCPRKPSASGVGAPSSTGHQTFLSADPGEIRDDLKSSSLPSRIRHRTPAPSGRRSFLSIASDIGWARSSAAPANPPSKGGPQSDLCSSMRSLPIGPPGGRHRSQ